MQRKHHLGLELTDNSKVGWAFSLSRKSSCINATDLCRKLCYGNGIRYQSDGQKAKRIRNFRTAEFLLERGGPELLAENLIALVDQARPVDWLAASICGEDTVLPWSLRIHDVGDHYSVEYSRAWLIAVRSRPDCKFWFYTRSFIDQAILAVLSELAALPNCKGLLSIDSDNFEQGLKAFATYPGIWKLALLQEDASRMNPLVMERLGTTVGTGQVVNFPYHRGGSHVVPIQADALVSCPQITTRAFPLERSRYALKPCQSCAICLP